MYQPFERRTLVGLVLRACMHAIPDLLQSRAIEIKFWQTLNNMCQVLISRSGSSEHQCQSTCVPSGTAKVLTHEKLQAAFYVCNIVIVITYIPKVQTKAQNSYLPTYSPACHSVILPLPPPTLPDFPLLGQLPLPMNANRVF